MKNKILIATVAFLALLILYFIFSGDESEISVRTKQATSEEIKTSILASGTLIYKDQIELRSEVIGQVSVLFIEEGEEVKRTYIATQNQKVVFLLSHL